MTSRETTRRKPKNTSKTTADKPDLAKTKRSQQQKQTPEQERFAAAKAQAEIPLTQVYGLGPRTGPRHVKGLAFDRGELHRLATAVAEARDKLKADTAGSAEDKAFTDALDRLQGRLDASRKLAERMELTQRLAEKTAGGVSLRKDPVTAGMWTLLEAEISAPDPVSANEPTRSDKVTALLADIETQLGVVDSILTDINRHPKVPPIRKIPAELLTAMGITSEASDIAERLKALKDGVLLEPDLNRLHDLLRAADSPTKVPGLIKDALAVQADLLDVLKECRNDNDEKDNTALARELLKKVKDTGQTDIAYFLTGEGGQYLHTFRYAARFGFSVWSGQTTPTAALRFGPVGAPVPFDQIEAIADPAAPAGHGSGRGPHRYIGRVHYNNGFHAGDTLLPTRDYITGQLITYTKYDVRPHIYGVLRGSERVVVGSDGRKYYTDDHYKTFKRMT